MSRTGRKRKQNVERYRDGRVKPRRDQYFGYQPCVYFVESENRGLVKIGKSSHRQNRVAGMSTGTPDNLITIAWVACRTMEEASSLEVALHRQLKKTNRHVRGEWFLLSQGDAKALAWNAEKYMERMRHWYAVMSTPKDEFLADAELRRQGFKTFCPLTRIRTRRRRPGTTVEAGVFEVKWIDVPRFNRYLFVMATPDDMAAINETRGVATIVHNPGCQPFWIPDDVMERIIAEAEAEQPKDQVSRDTLAPGVRFRIKEGNPLEGLIAQVSVDLGNKIRVVCDSFGVAREIVVAPEVVGEIVS